MLNTKPIVIDIGQYEFGWYIRPYRKVSKGVIQYFESDLQVASLLNMLKEEYVQLLMTNGAIDTANGITYFDTIEGVQIMQMIIETMYANVQNPENDIDL